MGEQIFISYRRGESQRSAERLYDRLVRYFDQQQIFMAREEISHRVGFVEQIEEIVNECEVLVAVIEEDWLTSKDELGNRPLDNPNDFVRLEIATALRHGIAVIPVLVGDTMMPRSSDLPYDLQGLVRRNALRISVTSFDRDSLRLISAISSALDQRSGQRKAREKEIPCPAQETVPRRTQLKRKGTSFFRLLRNLVTSSAESLILPKLKEEFKVQEPRLDNLGAPENLANLLASGKFPQKAEHRTFNTGGRESSPVDCTVFAPDRVERKQSALLQVFLHPPDDRQQVEADAVKFDRHTKERGHKSLVLDAPVGTIFAFIADIEGFEFRERKDTVLWIGKSQAATFLFDVPRGSRWGAHTGVVRIFLDGTPVGRINFQIEVVRDAKGALERPVGKEAQHYRACFCSYSSLDRAEMLKRAQGLRATGLKTFIDVMTLRPGDIWNPKIFAAIDESDLFVVIWSKNARDSKWVKKESRYALKLCKQRGTPDFVPIPVEGPPIPSVPLGLNARHFNDEVLSLIRAAEVEAQEREKKKTEQATPEVQ